MPGPLDVGAKIVGALKQAVLRTMVKRQGPRIQPAIRSPALALGYLLRYRRISADHDRDVADDQRRDRTSSSTILKPDSRRWLDAARALHIKESGCPRFCHFSSAVGVRTIRCCQYRVGVAACGVQIWY